MSSTKFLLHFGHQMLNEEKKELEEKPLPFIYFAGAIPSRSTADLLELRELIEERIEAFYHQEQKAEDNDN